ncbi:MAG: MFS transporter [Candidatus Baltobacteraceae bacterium]
MSIRSMNIGTRVRIPEAARLSFFWFGIQVVWGAVLGVLLQVRLVSIFGGDAAQKYALFAAAGAAAAILAQLLSATLSDRAVARERSRAPLYLVGTIVSVGAIVAFLSVGSAIALFAAYLALQIGMNIAVAPYQAAVPEYLQREHQRAGSAWLAAMQSLGNAVGAVIAALLSLPLTAAVVPALLLGSFLLGYRSLARVVVAPVVDEGTPKKLTRAHVDLFGSRAMIFLAFYTMLGYLYFWVLGSGFAGFAAPRTVAGAAIVVFTLTGIAGALLAARLGVRFELRATAILGIAAFAVATALYASAGGLTVLSIASIVGGLGWGAFLSADWALGARYVLPGARALGFALWNLAVVLPQFFAPSIIGVLATFLRPVGPSATSHFAFGIAFLELIVGMLWLVRLPKSEGAMELRVLERR